MESALMPAIGQGVANFRALRLQVSRGRPMICNKSSDLRWPRRMHAPSVMCSWHSHVSDHAIKNS
eukprot:8014948-Pyramimonas_sp.AAC.1